MKNGFFLGLSALFIASFAFASSDDIKISLKSKPAQVTVVRIGPGRPTDGSAVWAMLAEDKGFPSADLICADFVDEHFVRRGIGYFIVNGISDYRIRSYDSCMKLWEALRVASAVNPVIVEVDNGTGEVLGAHN